MSAASRHGSSRQPGNKSGKKDDKDQPMKNPIERMFAACLMLLGCVIALSFALSLLAQMWPWLVLIGLVIGGIWFAVRRAVNKRREW